MLDVVSVDEVFRIINHHFAEYALENETIPIETATGRILAEDLVSSENIPGFNRSQVDGYAVMASDTFGASESLPAQLFVAGDVKMGEKPNFSLKKGQAAYIPTGGELPVNADAVVMVEYTENLDDGFIYIAKPAAPGNHIVFTGDDVTTGAVVQKAGIRLRPQDIGLFAALGDKDAVVKRKVRVGIVSTGDEIIPIDQNPKGAQVRDVNSYALYSQLLQMHTEPLLYGIVTDDYDKMKSCCEKALEVCDIVLLSGGSSAGTKDETFRVITSIGKPGVLIHGIAVKPGKPTILGKTGKKAVVGLPGHPASAFMICHVFVRHLIEVMCDITPGPKQAVKAEMTVNYPSNNGREEFVSVVLSKHKENYHASPVFSKSGLISMLSSSHGYVHIPRGSEGISRGAIVDVLLF